MLDTPNDDAPLTADYSYIAPHAVDLVLNEFHSPKVDPSSFTSEHLSRVADYVVTLEGRLSDRDVEIADLRRQLHVARQVIATRVVADAIALAKATAVYDRVRSEVEATQARNAIEAVATCSWSDAAVSRAV